uniref:Uncharacterized protein n=1 Tax=Kalanchoe fedtschenkoi TaxID=63787 RepID=A0A7N0TJD5_KALFE
MGVSFSRLYSFCHDWFLLQDEVETATASNPIASSTGHAATPRKTLSRSISIGRREQPEVLVSAPAGPGSGKEMKLQMSVSFKRSGAAAAAAPAETQTSSTTISITPHFGPVAAAAAASDAGVVTQSSSTLKSPAEPGSSKMKLRRTFGSRRRRSGSGSVVPVGPHWWKLLESTELERSSTESASTSESPKSKWCRAKVKALRVGKGLSKNVVFRKLASQHWLEAVDPGHRYGHNLRFYYVRWCQSPSRESFFHWLNHGEGKDLNLDETCPRFKLHQQRVRYLCPAEREAYEVLFDEGKLRNKMSSQLIDTSGGSKWIFVLSTSKTLYVGKKKKGLFHHSSFLAGGAISAAGRVSVENGVLKAISRQSGHYRPTEENFKYFISFLEENNVDLTVVDKSCMDEGEAQPKRGLGRNWSQEDLTQLVGPDQAVKTPNRQVSKTFRIRSLRRRLSFVLIPEKHHPFRSFSAPLCR